MSFPIRLLNRVTKRIDASDRDGCWPWTGAMGPTGYGVISYTRDDGSQTSTRPHRVMFEAMVGPIPDGLVIDHLCRNRACCNPAHMEAVTSRENTRRSPLIIVNECKQGHPYTDKNTYIDKRGCRSCLTCRRERSARSNAKASERNATRKAAA